MRYNYAYKTPDGTRLEASIESASRDEAFAELRKQGIRPIKVVADDGTKANGEIRVFGIPRKWFFVAVVVTALVAAVVTWRIASSRKPSTITVEVPVEVPVESSAESPLLKRAARPLPRQEIHGSRRRLEIIPTNVFANAIETYLSKFAEPGREVEVADMPMLAIDTTNLVALLEKPIYFSPDEYTEYIDLKRITAGIKKEMLDFVNGGGTAEEYFDALVERQNQELSHRAKAEQRLISLSADATRLDKAYNYWLNANAQLQSMGIYPLPLPEFLREYQSALNFDD